MPQKYQFERLPGPSDTLPESPCWHGLTHRLFWVDHGSRDLRAVKFPERDFVAVPLKTKGNLRFVKSLDAAHLIVGSERGLYRLEIETGMLTAVGGTLPLTDQTCINDGAIHPNGAIAIALSDIAEHAPTGGFYLLGPDGWTCILGEVVIGNGPAFSQDGSSLFLSDTLGQRILRYDLATGKSEGFVDLSDGDGLPDGLFVSQSGDLWVSFWAGTRIEVVRDGKRIKRIGPTPGRNVTCCCLIGDAPNARAVTTICDSRETFENGTYQVTI
ncbi:MAG: SMP-30/gluconolactonase/LRE family protein [Pseudomonadota bacterium]